MSTKLFKEFLLLECMVLIEVLKEFVGKRDKREKDIEDLLKKALKEWPNNSFEGKSYLDNAIKIKLDIKREKGKIYFDKYPEISIMLGEAVNKLFEYQT